MKRLVFLIILAFSSSPNCCFSQETQKTVQVMIDKANSLHLASDPQWRKILFYQRKYFRPRQGLVDAPAFYLSPEGKTSPQKELEATINSFFSGAQGNAAAQCTFPRRLKWLKSKLDDDTFQIPVMSCPKLENWLATVNPKGVAFIFSSFYINNPSSMFGHTFLRIASSNNALTDYGVNYAANPDTDIMLLYAFKGLTGMFDGRFSLLPYSIKVQEYNNSESRDLWEYELNLSQDQISDMMLSLWEVGDNRIDYYYIDENCSFVLLALLDTADEHFNFTDQFLFIVNPSDTLRAVTRYPGLVKKVTFRPSSQRRFESRFAVLSSSERDLFEEVLDKKISPNDLVQQNTENSKGVSKESAARILTAVSEYIDYEEHLAGTEESKKYPVFRKQLLNARAATRVVSPPLNLNVTESEHPESGVPGSRMGLIYSYSNSALGALDYELRPVLHDLRSPPAGYSSSAQIEMADTDLRYEFVPRSFYFNRFSLIKILSVPPLHAPSYPISWQLEGTLEQDGDCEKGFYDASCRRYFVGGGSGFSAEIAARPIALHAYVLPTAQLGYMNAFGFETLFGLDGGAIVTLCEKVVLAASAQWFKRYSISQNQWRDHLLLDSSLAFPILNSFEGRAQYNYNFQTAVWRFGAAIYWYFF